MQAVLIYHIFLRRITMPHLEELVKDVIEKRIAANAAHEAEITQLTKVIAGEQKEIENDYAKIGELYYKQNSDKTEGELGEMVAKVNESNEKIKDSKMKIGTLMGYTFCETCGEQVDEDDLYCNNCGAKMPVKVLPGMELCPHCNKAVRAGIRFCTNCGKPMQEEEKPKVKECPSCGFTTEDLDMVFCEKCNRRLVMEGGDPEEETVEVEKQPTHKVCPACGFKIFDAETMFCEKCNRRLVEEGSEEAAE